MILLQLVLPLSCEYPVASLAADPIAQATVSALGNFIDCPSVGLW